MATNRTPLSRTPHGRVTPEAVEKFRAIRELETNGVGGWEHEGGRRREWYDLRGALHRMLGRNAGDADVMFCDTPTPEGSHLPFDDHYRESHKLYLELAQAAEG